MAPPPSRLAERDVARRSASGARRPSASDSGCFPGTGSTLTRRRGRRRRDHTL